MPGGGGSGVKSEWASKKKSGLQSGRWKNCLCTEWATKKNHAKNFLTPLPPPAINNDRSLTGGDSFTYFLYDFPPMARSLELVRDQRPDAGRDILLNLVNTITTAECQTVQPWECRQTHRRDWFYTIDCFCGSEWSCFSLVRLICLLATASEVWVLGQLHGWKNQLLPDAQAFAIFIHHKVGWFCDWKRLCQCFQGWTICRGTVSAMGHQLLYLYTTKNFII